MERERDYLWILENTKLTTFDANGFREFCDTIIFTTWTRISDILMEDSFEARYPTGLWFNMQESMKELASLLVTNLWLINHFSKICEKIEADNIQPILYADVIGVLEEIDPLSLQYDLAAPRKYIENRLFEHYNNFDISREEFKVRCKINEYYINDYFKEDLAKSIATVIFRLQYDIKHSEVAKECLEYYSNISLDNQAPEPYDFLTNDQKIPFGIE